MNAPLLHRLASSEVGPLLARLLLIADDAVVVADAEHRIVLFNEGAERVFGHAAVAVIGEPLNMLLPAEVHERHGRHMRQFALSSVAARTMGARTDLHGRRADGSLFKAQASIAHVELEGRLYYAAILRDVTEQREAERELERAKAEAESAAHAKGLFLANLSHEIRTPLNAVVGMTSLLLGTPMSDEQREYARTIRSSGEALQAIISDILDFSKSEAGMVEIEQIAFDLRAVVEESLDLVAPRAAEKGLNLAYLIEDGTPEALVGDASRLRQILLNLLSNAVKFTHQGEVLVVVQGSAIEDGQCLLHLAVKDSGIGIAEEHLPRLFQSFSQVDASTTRKYGGTGLGLAISRRLAELMGGSITVQSQPGAGSVFDVTVQLGVSPAATPPVFLLRDAPGLRGRRVLIVDANVTNRRILSKLTLRWGMVPTVFPSALEVQDRIRLGQCHDLALIDMGLPEFGGLALAAQIRSDSACAPMPVVMLAGLGQRQASQALEGVAAVVAKPIKAAELHATLLRVLQAAPPSTMPAPAPPLAERMPLRLLVAEDNLVNQKVILQLLGRLGYSADLASNGLEVLDAVERQDYDVVLMDIQMPEMDGLQAARWIAQHRRRDGRPRVVAMTANPLRLDRRGDTGHGIDACLPKPIELSAVSEVLQAVQRLEPPALRPTAPATKGGLDYERLEHLRALQDERQPSLVRDVIDLFTTEAPLQLQAITHAVERGDCPQLRELAHRFMSTTQNIGAVTLSPLCEALERLAIERRPGDAPNLLGQMAHEHRRVAAELAIARLLF